MGREDNFTLYIVLGMIATVLIGAALVYGTLGVVIYHFVHKLW